MNNFNEKQEIREVYNEDTRGRKYHTPIVTKKDPRFKAESGPVTSIDLNAPMTWTEFKALPDTLKIKYLEHLRDYYRANMSTIARMFGITQPTLQPIVNKLGLKGTFSRAPRVLRDNDLAKWNTFLNSGKDDSEANVVDDFKEEQTPIETESSGSMKFTGCTFSFEGKFNVQDIVKKLSVCIDEGTECRIRISMWGNEDDATN